MPNRPVAALIPFRSPGRGKTRLGADGLTPTQRAALSGAMLADVAAALRTSPVASITVAAAGEEAAAVAAALGLDAELDPPGTVSLDAAVAAAASRSDPRGALLVVMGDLPRLTAADIEHVLERPSQVVVAPTRDGGTGALLRSPPSVMPTAYGPGSGGRHVRVAEAAGLAVTTVTSGGFAEDVDTIQDLRDLRDRRVGAATQVVLDEILGQLRDQ